jgi:fluoride exporter
MTPAARSDAVGSCLSNPPPGGFCFARLMARLMGVNVLSYMWIAVGSALGGMGRYWISGTVAQQFGETFPWGTIIVNVTGSFIIGFFATLTGPDGRFLASTSARQFVMVGLCGGYTTFSSFSLQTLNQAREGDWLGAGANIGLSVLLCLIAVWLGHIAALALNQLKGA